MNKITQLFCLFILLILSSCATRKQYIYFQDMEELKEYPVSQKYEATVHRDDRLSITVTCKNPELTLPFNIPGSSDYSISADGNISAGTTSNESNKGFLVDVNGCIDYPMLGKLHVEGLTRNQLKELIQNKLIAEDLIKDPIVSVNFLNFKITMLGEVNSQGTIPVNGDRITLIDAIAQAGGLKTSSKINRIAVIREYGDKRRILFHDLRSKDIFNSPCYYLQQNDIVYVEPNFTRSIENTQRQYSIFTMVMSFVTTITSLCILAFN